MKRAAIRALTALNLNPTAEPNYTSWSMHAWVILLLAQPLTVSPPLSIDPGVIADAGGRQHDVALTPHRDGWFAVWADDRMWNRELSRTTFADWIFGAHVEPDGTIAPAVSLYLAGDTTMMIDMQAITTHNGGLALAYVEEAVDERLALLLLDDDGAPIGARTVIATSTDSFGIANVRGWDLGGGQALIRWDESLGASGARINLSTIDASGAVIRTTSHDASGSDYTLDCNTERCTLLDEVNLSLRARDILILTGVESAPIIVADVGEPGGAGRLGDTVVVLYTDAFNTLCAKRIHNGVLLDPNPILIANQVRDPISVSTRAGDVLFAWTPHLTDTVAAARINAAGELLDPAPFFANTDDRYELDTVVWNAAGDRALISGTGGSIFREQDIVVARVEPDGAGLLDTDVRSISQAINTQRAPAVAYGAGMYLVAWEDLRVKPARIRAQRVGEDGVAIGAPIELGITGVLGHPTAGFDGTQFWVAWSSTRAEAQSTGNAQFDVFAARIAIDGTLLDPAAITVAGSTDEEVDAELSCTPSSCYISWIGYNRQMGLFSRLLADGTVANRTGIQGCLMCSDLSLTFDGTQLVVVYTALPSGAIVMRTFDPDGAPLEPGVVVPNFSGLLLDELALSGSNAGEVALRVRDANDMRTLLLDTAASPLRVASECSGCALTGHEPGAIAFDGRDFVVAANGFLAAEYPRQQLYATRVSTTAASLESEAASIADAALAWSAVAAASDGRGHTLIVRSAYDEDPAISAARIEARMVTNPRAERPADPDAGVQPDSGPNMENDAGIDGGTTQPDAAADDAGTAEDAGVISAPDAGAKMDTVDPNDEKSCACSSGRAPADGSAPLAALSILCAAFALRAGRLRRTGTR